MIVYLLTIIIILILGHLYSFREARTHQSCRKPYIITVSVILTLQSGLRNWAVGTDTYAYYEKFEKVKVYSWSQIRDIVSKYYLHGIGKDPGYDILQKVIQFFLPDYQMFLLFIASIFFVALGNFIYKNTTRLSDAVLAYVLYCCLFFNFFSITGHRQTIATAASLYGYELIKKRKLLTFLLLILLASTIHKSVLIFIPLYFVVPLKKTIFLYCGSLLLFPVLMIYRTTFSQILQNLGGYGDYEVFKGAGTYTFSFMLLFVAIVALWRMKKVILQNEAVRQVYIVFIFALITTPLTWVNPAAMRVVQYYSIFLLVLVPAVINSFELDSQKMRKMVCLAFLYLLIGLFIKANINSEYKFYWQDMALGENYK